MNTRLVQFGFCIILLILVIFSNATAQSHPAETKNYDCEEQPLGLFRQLTGTKMKLSGDYYDSFFMNKESDLRENRWTLDPLDEVDPAYKLFLIRNPSNAYKAKCGATMDVVGNLISPTGKLFDFKQATYDIPARKLKFITLERDGITYEVEAFFYAVPREVNGMYEKGTATLKASGKLLGTVTIEFKFSSWNRE